MDPIQQALQKLDKLPCYFKSHFQVKLQRIFYKLEPESQLLRQYIMAATSISMASTKFSSLGWIGGKKEQTKRRVFSISAQQQAEVKESQQVKEEEKVTPKQTPLRPVERQTNVQSRNMSREFGGQWLCSVTRHVRIYAAYIDPETWEFDQTQIDKLTLILDPTKEFVWTDESVNKVFVCFQELVDHYEVIFSYISNHFHAFHLFSI